MKQHRWECAARARLGEDAGQRDVLWLAVQMQARARVTVRHQ
jgi:hypothetical protein